MMYYDALVKINGELMCGRISASKQGYTEEGQPVWLSIDPRLIENTYSSFDKEQFHYLGPCDLTTDNFLSRCEITIAVSDKDVTLTATDQKSGNRILTCTAEKGDTHA